MVTTGLTTEQLEERRQSIGSSDVAAIFGLDRYRSAYDVWLEKTGAVELSTNQTTAARFGTYMESGILNYAEETLGELLRDVLYRKPEYHMHARLDAEVKSTKDCVDAKTCNRFADVFEEFGEPGTDQIPEGYILQAHAHMMCSPHDPRVCHIPVLLGDDLRMYSVMRDEGLCATLAKELPKWWQRHVITKTPPDVEIAGSTMETLKRVRRAKGEMVKVDGALVQRWLDLSAARRAIEKVEEETKAKLIAQLGNAEMGDAGKVGTISYLETARKEYVVKASTYRQLRHRKPQTKGSK